MAEADFQRPVQNKELKCPICLDFYIDPVQLPCGHNFCLTCIRAVWDCDISEAGPFFCPECQIFLEANLSLEVNTSLQKEVQDFTTRDLDIQEVPPTPLFIPCDHCIGTGSVAVKTCLTCDASLCSAHVELHLKKVAFREHTVIEVTGNPFSFKCSEHREELKLFCQEDGVSVCSLCVVIGSHKDHQVVTSQEACTEMKKLVEDNLTRLVEKRQAAEESMRGLECLFSETAFGEF
ncbi:E3 ubiquitin/ISG15 ligase TRIM25 [Amia ocellicauda]|uniref:E3 ubiquitin/ISG15 ligase TRIM25 n=1 Tax=Amia ocellicauda TaxID=2972642 RepID=UPI0034647C78